MLSGDLGVDFGTANTVIYARGRGIVVNEPSILAASRKTGAIEAVGIKARNMVGRAPHDVAVLQPLSRGVIADSRLAGSLLAEFVRRCRNLTFGKPRILLAIPNGSTQIERRAAVEAAYRAGARKVLIIKRVAAAALGAGLNIHEPRASMIVDIGAGATEIAVFSLSGIVISEELRIAGNQFDESIMDYLERKHQIIVGEPTAERTKIGVGSACPVSPPLGLEVRGKDKVTGMPKKVIVSDDAIRMALADDVASIANAIRAVLGRLSPDLCADVYDRGIHLTGGGALLRNIDKYLELDLGVRTFVDSDPLLAVIRGAVSILETPGLLGHLASPP